MEISEAVPEDAEAIGRLHALVHELHVNHLAWHFKTIVAQRLREIAKENIQKDDTYSFVARVDGKIVGYVIGVLRKLPESVFAKEYNYMYLDQIAVDPAFQRKAVGRKLIIALTNCARQNGLDQVVLDTWEFNDKARCFFQSMGFRRQMQRLALNLKDDTE